MSKVSCCVEKLRLIIAASLSGSDACLNNMDQ